jgi:CBS domain containing-hemolysin-like protein
VNAGQAVGILALLLANGFFVGAEFALISARRTQIEPLAQAGSGRARAVLSAMESMPTMLAGAQFGVTVASLALGAMGEPAVAHTLEPLFRAVGLPADLLHPVSFAFALTLVVAGHIILGEMVPKNLALSAPERAVLWAVPLLLAFVRLTRPILAVIRSMSDLILRLLRIPPIDEARTVYTAGELPALIDESREYRLLDQDEHERMTAMLALHAQPVRAVTLPLAEVVAVPAGTTAAQLQDYAGRYGHSRFPVRGQRPDRLTGYLHILDALGDHPAEEPLPVRPLPRIPAETTLAEVLAAMRARRAQLVAVVEPGGTALGVATLDDVLSGLLHTPPR